MSSNLKQIKLSPYHEIFYNEWKLNPQSSDYNIVLDNEFQAEVDPGRLERALNRLSQNYFLLQSRIEERKGKAFWVPAPGSQIKLDYFPSALNDDELLEYVKTPFSLEKGGLLRVALIKLGDSSYRLILIFHHLIMDGSKANFAFNAIPYFYDNPTYKFEIGIKEQMQKLNDLSRKLESEVEINEEDHRTFWNEQLSQLTGPDLRFLKGCGKEASRNDQEVSNHIGECLFSLDKNFGDQLRQIKRKFSITPYLYSQALFALLLHRYTDQARIGICYMVSVQEGADFIYGAHVNPCFIPFEFSDEMGIVDLLENTKTYFKKVKTGKHHYYPIQRILSRYLQNNLLEVGFSQTDLKNECFPFNGASQQKINTELNLDCSGKLLFSQEFKEGVLNFRVLYKKAHVDRELLLNFIESYKTLLKEVTEDLLSSKENLCISNSPDFLNSSQYRELIYELNDNSATYPSTQTLHQLFEKQVLRTPNNIALVYEDNRLTYKELNEITNNLAHLLIDLHDMRPNKLVGLFLDRNHLAIIAQIAVLKSGGAYVPIDISYPNYRIHQIIQDTRCTLVITNPHYRQRLLGLTTHQQAIIPIDPHSLRNKTGVHPRVDPVTETVSTRLAYVIYTSGTTGKPKGVMVEHQSAVNLAYAQANSLALSNESDEKSYLRCLGFSNYVFDAHVWEYFVTFLNGHSLYLVNETIKQDIQLLRDYIQINEIDLATLPPVVLNSTDVLPLKHLIVAGEKTDASIINAYLDRGIQISNAYGPTESTVCATIHHYARNDCPHNIGQPIANTQVYILDHLRRPMPKMAIGEIYIAGEGVARGYLHNQELTDEKFVNNLFRTTEEKRLGINKKMYKTGDLARWTPDGSIEYIGRIDEQIKVNGCRIEPGEIETNLLTYPGIEKCVVLLKGPDGMQLAAYYVSKQAIPNELLREYLTAKLPLYMVPKFIIHLRSLPLSVNGKLNKCLLPNPELTIHQQYIAPRNEIEFRVCNAFAKVLGIPENQVGMRHDFFDLGGESMAAIRLASMLRAYFNVNIRDIFELKTPEKLIQSLPIIKDDLYEHVAQIRQMYENTAPYIDLSPAFTEIPSIKHKYRTYFEARNKCDMKFSTKPIKSIFLTGGTGHLGCHILNKLLTDTQYHIYLPVRSETESSSHSKISDKYAYYFDVDLSVYRDRISIIKADLEKPQFDLSNDQYHLLIKQVDSVIHCAALLKHYGRQEEFYKANVQATLHLLEFTKLSTGKDFHYISTISVLLWGHVPHEINYLFTEEDEPGKLVIGNSHYVQTKYQAELLAMQWRECGINSSIYRVGNLGMNSSNYRMQEMGSGSLFVNHLRAMIEFGMVPDEISQFELSPVDYTASAIVKLFDKVNLSNQVHHVFNPNACDLYESINKLQKGGVKKCNLVEFITKILNNLDFGAVKNQSHFFIIYQMWLQELENGYTTKIRVSQDKTEEILDQLGFRWIEIDPLMFSNLVNPRAN